MTVPRAVVFWVCVIAAFGIEQEIRPGQHSDLAVMGLGGVIMALWYEIRRDRRREKYKIVKDARKKPVT